MALNTRSAIVKTSLLAPGGSLLSWGIQQLLGGDPYTGAAAVSIGVLLLGGFVILQERDVPYDDEIIEIVDRHLGEMTQDEIEYALKEVAESAGDGIESARGGSDGG
jgi:hypothetical protein